MAARRDPLNARPLRPPCPGKPACAGTDPEMWVRDVTDESDNWKNDPGHVAMLRSICAACPANVRQWCLEVGVHEYDRMSMRAGYRLWNPKDARDARKVVRKVSTHVNAS